MSHVGLEPAIMIASNWKQALFGERIPKKYGKKKFNLASS
jgi:hypothetical protein